MYCLLLNNHFYTLQIVYNYVWICVVLQIAALKGISAFPVTSRNPHLRGKKNLLRLQFWNWRYHILSPFFLAHTLHSNMPTELEDVRAYGLRYWLAHSRLFIAGGIPAPWQYPNQTNMYGNSSHTARTYDLTAHSLRNPRRLLHHPAWSVQAQSTPTRSRFDASSPRLRRALSAIMGVTFDWYLFTAHCEECIDYPGQFVWRWRSVETPRRGWQVYWGIAHEIDSEFSRLS